MNIHNPNIAIMLTFCSPLPIFSLSGVDRHDCLPLCFSVLCKIWVELVLSQITPHSVHPPRSVWAFLEVSSLPPSSLLLALQHSCLLFSIHGHTTKGVSGSHNVVIGLTIASLLNFLFLIRSFLVLPLIHLSIFILVVCILCCSALCSAQHSLPYIRVGLMTVLYSLFFSLTGAFLSQITPR